MKNKKLIAFNVITLCILLGVIYIGNYTWGTNHETREVTEIAKETIEEETDVQTKQRAAVEIQKHPELIHTSFKEKQQTDFDSFNHHALEIVEMEEEEKKIWDEEVPPEDEVVDEQNWEAPIDSVHDSSDATHQQINTEYKPFYGHGQGQVEDYATGTEELDESSENDEETTDLDHVVQEEDDDQQKEDETEAVDTDKEDVDQESGKADDKDDNLEKEEDKQEHDL